MAAIRGRYRNVAAPGSRRGHAPRVPENERSAVAPACHGERYADRPLPARPRRPLPAPGAPPRPARPRPHLRRRRGPHPARRAVPRPQLRCGRPGHRRRDRRDRGEWPLAGPAAGPSGAAPGGGGLAAGGLRRVVLPSLLVTAACWSVAPFVGYWPLLGLAALAGLFVVPTFSVIRQAVLVAAPEGDRRTALALDSVAVEMSFMVGPVLGVWAATVWPTSWVLFGIEMLGVLAAIALWVADPVLRAEP